MVKATLWAAIEAGEAPPEPKADPAKPIPGPWEASDWGKAPDTRLPYCIRILGADGTKVCDVMHHASGGGQGIAVARATAAWIVKNGPKGN